MAAIDLTGTKFGTLTALRIDEERTTRGRGGKIVWECRCDCGGTSYVQTNNLRSGSSTTCGGRVHRLIDESDGPDFFKPVYERYRSHAESKGVSFEISMARFAEICNEMCHYCGADGSMRVRRGRGRRNGIDCKDPCAGYVDGNILPCCWLCNKMKGVMSYESFTDQIARIFSKLR